MIKSLLFCIGLIGKYFLELSLIFCRVILVFVFVIFCSLNRLILKKKKDLNFLVVMFILEEGEFIIFLRVIEWFLFGYFFVIG